MSEKEFIAYVDSFNKRAGEYTKDEAFQIGLKFKELPIKPMTWKELATKLGYRNGEALRGLVKNRLNSDGLLESQKDVVEEIQEQIINNKLSDSEDVINEIESKLATLYKEQQKYRDIMTAYRRAMREDARLEVLTTTVGEAIKGLPNLTNFGVNFKINNQSPKDAILMFSDWHIGQDCDNFYNKYNVDIAKERVEKVVDETIKYCQTFNISKLNVLNLGDLIEGNINTTGRIESNERVLEQLMIATEIMANALNKLQSFIPEVTYRSVTDNHSNINSSKKERIDNETLNMVTTWYLKVRLEKSNIKFKDDNLDVGLGRFELSEGKKVSFFHGHEDPKDKVLQNLLGATHEWTDIVCCGHWHNPAEHVYQDMRLFINGSLCGTGPYALSHRMFTNPSQKLIIIEKDNYINIDISVK